MSDATSGIGDDLSPANLNGLRRRIVNWFEKEGRRLPWRENHDPYQIWVSEIMLQQTTVKAVIPYFERFTQRFPTVHDLAAASEAEVLQYWEGLGYYSRGRNLRKAAIFLVDQFDGQFPETLAELQSLPGVGRYTAGAIRSFAFDLPAPIVEANTLRLYCRLLNYQGDPRSKEGDSLLWSFAEKLQPRHHASQLNQALMELGSQVCTPKEPDCSQCPLQKYCRAFQSQTQHKVPRPKERPQVTKIVEATVAVQREGQFLIRQRGVDERWSGMWDFLRFPMDTIVFSKRIEGKTFATLSRDIIQHLQTEYGLVIQSPEMVTEQKHSVTRYRIRLLCLRAELEEDRSELKTEAAHFRWVRLSELTELPMPVTGRQFAETLTHQFEA